MAGGSRRESLVIKAERLVVSRKRIKVVELMRMLGCAPSTMYRIVNALTATGAFRLENKGSNIFEAELVYVEG